MNRIEEIEGSHEPENVLASKQIYERIIGLQVSTDPYFAIWNYNGEIYRYKENDFSYVTIQNIIYIVKNTGFRIALTELSWILEALGYKTKRTVLITYSEDHFTETKKQAWELIL
jgi:hypothetical protein